MVGWNLGVEPRDTIKRIVQQYCPPDYNPVDYVDEIVRPLAAQQLNECIKNCNACDICKAKAKTLFKGTGNEPIMIIGETALIKQVNDKAEPSYPFENTEEGVMLNKVFAAYGIDTSKIMWINAVNCFSSRINLDHKLEQRTPCSKEINSCKVFLDYALRAFKPKLIIVLGNIALNVFKTDTILKARGNFFSINGIQTMPTYNPHYFLDMKGIRTEEDIAEDKADFCEDVKNAFLWFNKNYPDEKIFINNNIKEYE